MDNIIDTSNAYKQKGYSAAEVEILLNIRSLEIKFEQFSKDKDNFVTKDEFEPVKNNYVTKDDYEPVKKIVWGIVWVILVAVTGGGLSLIIVKGATP